MRNDLKMDEYIKLYNSSNYSILNINEQESKRIDYMLDLNNSIIKISKDNRFEQTIPKMRTSLNNSHFLEVMKMYINLNKIGYRLYLQDYCIKDNIIIKILK